MNVYLPYINDMIYWLSYDRSEVEDLLMLRVTIGINETVRRGSIAAEFYLSVAHLLLVTYPYILRGILIMSST